MADYGIKVSQPGYDVKTATDIQLVFSSKFDALPIALQGSANQTGNSPNTLTFTIAHGLSFTPFVIVFYKTSFYNSYWQWSPAGGISFLGDNDTPLDFGMKVDGTNLIIRVSLGNGSSDTINIRYFIFNRSL